MGVGHNRCVQMFRFGAIREVGNEGTKFEVRRGLRWGGAGRGKVVNVVLYKPFAHPYNGTRVWKVSEGFALWPEGFALCPEGFPFVCFSTVKCTLG